jgi:hypothetical protein
VKFGFALSGCPTTMPPPSTPPPSHFFSATAEAPRHTVADHLLLGIAETEPTAPPSPKPEHRPCLLSAPWPSPSPHRRSSSPCHLLHTPVSHSAIAILLRRQHEPNPLLRLSVAVPHTSRHTPVPPPPVRPLPLSPMTPLPEPQPTAISEPSQARLRASFLSLHRPLLAAGKTPLLLLSSPPSVASRSSRRPMTRPLPPYFFSFCAAQQQVAHLFFPGLASSPPSVVVQPSRPACGPGPGPVVVCSFLFSVFH